MRAVPCDWIANSTTRIATAIDTTYGPSPGAAMVSPSSAESTEIAGVIAPSPFLGLISSHRRLVRNDR
jgi:hypothetical protein